MHLLAPSLITAAIVAVVFAHLYRVERERYLLIWAVAWAFWVVRYSYGILFDTTTIVSGAVVLPALALLRASLMLWGSYELLGRPAPRWWWWVVAVDVAVIGYEALNGASLSLAGGAGFTHYVIFGTALVWSGVLFIRSRASREIEHTATGVAFVLYGLLQVTFPWQLFQRLAGSAYGFGIDYALQTVIGVGIVFASLRRSEAERLALLRRDRALTLALADYIPICAHCKSIREGDQWVPLERYIRQRTTAELSHGVCPMCVQEHYSELEEAEE